MHSFHPAKHIRCMCLHERQRFGVSTKVREHWRQQAKVADAGTPAQKIGRLRTMRFESLEEREVVRLNKRLILIADSKRSTGCLHTSRSAFSKFVLLGTPWKYVSEPVHYERRILLGEVPAIVHGWPEQTLGTNHIE